MIQFLLVVIKAVRLTTTGLSTAADTEGHPASNIADTNQNFEEVHQSH